ncbi:MAG: NADH dehydrogenase subunit [Bacteroidales bacterium]|nr:NADH dehydrogenase subunit [Bacteroidales bacterium]
MEERKYIELTGNPVIMELSDIPVLEYQEFRQLIDDLLKNERAHCLTYFVYPQRDRRQFICCMGMDVKHTILVFSHEQAAMNGLLLESITQRHFCFHVFEREIHENYGIGFIGHPWLKPVRFPFDRADQSITMNAYPFYSIDGEELHEVGVGPIHAGVIEPGYFRFICHGENVLHLEIQLGYQHRGIERNFIAKSTLLQRAILAESIAGDTTIGHSMAFGGLMETLGDQPVSPQMSLERAIALELERIAAHIGDTAAICGDIAYQFGQVVNEALRTIVINTTQRWCGNRFGKGLIRPGGAHYPLTPEIKLLILKNLAEVEGRFTQITGRMFTMPSVLGRFEAIGTVTAQQAKTIGAVGMAARSCGLMRDIRWSHPFGAFRDIQVDPVALPSGDVWSRTMLRKLEVDRSIAMIREFLERHDCMGATETPTNNMPLRQNSFALSLTEGWRGEICHAAITGDRGELVHYKVKDPSFHNWMALALAVRNQEISDFPLCNKSYNLSYCGNDL